MTRRSAALFGLALALPVLPVFAGPWPQAGGPEGTYRAAGSAPTQWSVARGENIVWRTPLPGGGQGGVAVWKDRLFVCSFPTYEAGKPKFSGTILGHCVDRKTGKLLWEVKLEGAAQSPMLYAFSDATSWTPVTDGKFVWFFNAAGEMGCWDFTGKEIWRRKFEARSERFNKQHEPILFENSLISLEPLSPGEPKYRADQSDWNYLRGLDKLTGKTLWIAEDATTFYCTSVRGRLKDGTPAILHGRGGPHEVPERPIGLSLTSLAKGREGKTLWRFQPEALPGGPLDGTTFQALYTMTWDQDRAYWFRHAPEESHLVLDAANGRLLQTQSLIRSVDLRRWNPSAGAYEALLGANIRDVKDFSSQVTLRGNQKLHVFPHWHANLTAHGYHYFLTSTGHRRNNHAPPGLSGPSHCVGRVHIQSGKVEYLEVPVTVRRSPGKADEPIYGEPQRTRAEDSRGIDIAEEDRSRTDGWQIAAFFASPLAADGKIFLSTLPGITYVLDARAPVLDQRALLAVNDLGPAGGTWSLSGLSLSDGQLFTRTSKELICIGKR